MNFEARRVRAFGDLHARRRDAAQDVVLARVGEAVNKVGAPGAEVLGRQLEQRLRQEAGSEKRRPQGEKTCEDVALQTVRRCTLIDFVDRSTLTDERQITSRSTCDSPQGRSACTAAAPAPPPQQW